MEPGESKHLGYWIAPGLIAAMMALTAAIQDLPRGPEMMRTMAHLGYPPYFPFLTAPAKLAGAIVLILPRLPILKEWAYAGFTILLLSAAASHLASGDGAIALAPLVTLGVLAASYRLRPAERRLSYT